MNVTPEGKIHFNKHNNNGEKTCVNCTSINSNILQTYIFPREKVNILDKLLKTCGLKVWKWRQLLTTAKEIIPNILAYTQQLETWEVLPATAVSVPLGTRTTYQFEQRVFSVSSDTYIDTGAKWESNNNYNNTNDKVTTISRRYNT